MKRILCLALCLTLFIPFAAGASNIDLTRLSDWQLQDLLERILAEQQSRNDYWPGGGDFYLPPHEEFSYNGGGVAVYSGPSNQYWRANNGKAELGGGRVRVWGTEGGWAMIGYGLSNNLYRVGWIPSSRIPYNLMVPELTFSYASAVITSDAQVTDDPIVQPTWLFMVPRGTRVTLLAYETFVDHWAYIETMYEGQMVRGFINKDRIRAD